MTMLMDMDALRERIYKVYSGMKSRAGDKKWKSGPRKGKVRVPGLRNLPFTKEQLWAYAVRAIGPSGVCRCPYCEDIGRPAFIIDLRNVTFDHYVPLAHGGSWELENIRICCEDCNRLKGKLSYPFFVALMASLEQWTDPQDREYVHACLRTHGLVISQGREGKALPAPEEVTVINTPSTMLLKLSGPGKDNW